MVKRIFKKTISWSSFRFAATLRERCRECLFLHLSRSLPTINIPHQSGTLVTLDKPTLTYYLSKSIVYIKVTLGAVRSIICLSETLDSLLLPLATLLRKAWLYKESRHFLMELLKVFSEHDGLSRILSQAEFPILI